MRLIDALLTEEEKEDKVWVVLDHLQEEEMILVGVSKTIEGAKAIKQQLIDKFDITNEDEQALIKIYETSLDKLAQPRLQFAADAETAFHPDEDDPEVRKAVADMERQGRQMKATANYRNKLKS